MSRSNVCGHNRCCVLGAKVLGYRRGMEHNRSRAMEREENAALRAAAARRATELRHQAEIAKKIVAIWESRLARRAPLWFHPTIGGAIAAGRPWLSFYCPACGQTGELDLRRLERHRGATLESLIPALSCRRCSPHPPFARITGLRADADRDAGMPCLTVLAQHCLRPGCAYPS
jgi:hypothetical protein